MDKPRLVHAEFKRETKYLVLKWDDIDKYLKMSYEFRHLQEIISTIGVGRINDGKKDNTYVVVNEDESYAEDVWMLIEKGKSLKEQGYVQVEDVEWPTSFEHSPKTKGIYWYWKGYKVAQQDAQKVGRLIKKEER